MLSCVVAVSWRGAARLVQDEKNQVVTVGTWMEHEWADYRLTWRPELFGGIEYVYVPASSLWTPDLVLYNKCVPYTALLCYSVSVSAHFTVQFSSVQFGTIE